MNQISEAYEKVVKRQKVFSIETDSFIDKMISNLQNDPNDKQIQDTKVLANKILEGCKDYYSLIGKLSKQVEKKFKADLDTVWDPKAVGGKESFLYQILVQHFVREGRFDLAQVFALEAGIEFEQTLHTQYVEMFHIQEALRKQNPDLAIQWATEYSSFLRGSGSSLEFRLHKVKYLTFVKNGMIQEALDYAKKHFYKFADTQLKAIQQLMCCILYVKRLHSSPYASFFDNSIWQSIQIQFAREYSHFLGQSFESPLYTCVSVGSVALPMIMKMSALMKDKAVEWSQQGELPVTIPLLDSQRYHSVFICPVTKEQGTEQNPPMMMVCGHVISKESLNRLSKGSMNARFKCPYCPVDSTASQAVRVYF